MIPIYPLKKGEGLPEKLRSRSQLTQKDVSAAVAEILAAVRARGDEALYEYEERFDHADLRKAGLAVTREEIEAAYRAVWDFVEQTKPAEPEPEQPEAAAGGKSDVKTGDKAEGKPEGNGGAAETPAADASGEPDADTSDRNAKQAEK